MNQFYFEKVDYRRSIAALASSLLRHAGCPTCNPTLAQADALLQGAPRNVVVLLLDGFGYSALRTHLQQESFFRAHLQGTLCSVFPPTTAAAATALETGLFPSQSGYLGWSVYWPGLGKNVQLYPNTLDDGTKAAAVHLAQTQLYAPMWTKEIRTRQGIPAYSVMENGDIEARTLEQLEEKLVMLTSLPGPHLIYGYLNQPDHLLHREGTGSAAVGQWLRQAEQTMQQLTQRCPDTLFFLTADHGFTDIEALCMEDFPELTELLACPPSIEPRAMNLLVREGCREKFCERFVQITRGSYRIYTRDEVLHNEMFGPMPFHPLFKQMLGDYLAVAQTKLTLFPTRKYMRSMVAAHGGMTPQELTVPLIVLRSQR